MQTKINILGTEYEFIAESSKNDPGLIDKNGYCDPYAKKIVIETDYEENHPDCVRNMDDFRDNVRRHEIIHAYLAESGLTEYSENEQLVDWIAWQFPKLLESFRAVDAIQTDRTIGSNLKSIAVIENLKTLIVQSIKTISECERIKRQEGLSRETGCRVVVLNAGMEVSAAILKEVDLC